MWSWGVHRRRDSDCNVSLGLDWTDFFGGFGGKHLEQARASRFQASSEDASCSSHFDGSVQPWHGILLCSTATSRYEVGRWVKVGKVTLFYDFFHISIIYILSMITFSFTFTEPVGQSSTTFGIQHTAWVTIPSTEGRHRGESYGTGALRRPRKEQKSQRTSPKGTLRHPSNGNDRPTLGA